MPEIAATNNAWHDGDRAISHSHSGRGFYLAAVVPMFEKTVISAFDCLNRSSCVLHCRTVGGASMFIAGNILYLRYKPA